MVFNTLHANLTKWSNRLKQFIGFCRRIVWVCLTILAVKCGVEALEHFLCIHACPGFEKLVPIFLNSSNAANTLKYLQLLPGITFTHKQDLSWCKKFWVEECELQNTPIQDMPEKFTLTDFYNHWQQSS